MSWRLNAHRAFLPSPALSSEVPHARCRHTARDNIERRGKNRSSPVPPVGDGRSRRARAGTSDKSALEAGLQFLIAGSRGHAHHGMDSA